MKRLNNPVFLVCLSAILYAVVGLMYMPWMPEAVTASFGFLGTEQGSEGKLVSLWARWAVGISMSMLLLFIIQWSLGSNLHKWVLVLQLALISICMAAQFPPLLLWGLFALTDTMPPGTSMFWLHLLLLLLAGWTFIRLIDQLKLGNGFENPLKSE